MVLEVFGILIFSLIVGIVASYYLERYLEPFKDKDIPKADMSYDFQEDIANYNNDWNGYDYDTHKENQYEFDIASEAELSQEYIQNHTEEDKN